MLITTLAVGQLGTNCYLVKKGGNLYIIDPGDEPQAILDAARQMGYQQVAVLLTHAHFDHIGAAGEICRQLALPHIYLAPGDRELYRSPLNSMPPWFGAVKDLPETADFEENPDFTVLAMPGHSPGGSAFVFENDTGGKAVFCGDSVFARSIGRTDLPGGDHGTLLASIRKNIVTLPGDTVLYPGHGEATTVADEIRYNPYFK